MARKISLAVSLAALTSALSQLSGCTSMCTCRELPGAKTPGATVATPATASAPATATATAAAAPASSAPVASVAYTWKNVVILGGGFVSGVVFSPIEKDL